ncbi:hypothetical protein ACFFGH_29805 [Lysobacter korlensis]|uniref:Uncharacterized protein n=1 Tax=Lysobacter korlensis TaxID=553636 RepID=A0ABV6S1P0_9GAMM
MRGTGTGTPRSQTEVLRGLISARLGSGPPRTLAVVGNAPLEPSADRAARIDEADAVVRMTTFDVDRGVPRTGTRTDVAIIHRATSPGPATFERYGERVYLLAEPGRLHWEREQVPPWWPADLGFVPISNAEFTRPLNRVLRFSPHSVTWATTGTLAVWVMHRLFPDAEVTLTGTSLLGARAHRVTTLEHAWGSSVQLTWEHRLAAERRALRSWLRAGWLRVRS